MIFASYTYIYFLLATLGLHALLPRAWRTPLLIAASYLFYCSWRWEYAFLLLAAALFNWAWGRWVLPGARSSLPLAVGIVCNLLPLVYYKYSAFLLDNLGALGQLAGLRLPESGFDPILPLGISFFTFQAIAYLVDVATGERPFRSLRDFMFYRTFWPQLIAGPIIRPGEIHEQIEHPRGLLAEDLAAGGRRVVIGLFKKVVLADTLGPYVDLAFAPQATPNFLDATAAIVGFGLQVYLDFSAYSDLAIGSARMFGYRFPENFDWPYLSRSPQEFWQRWHITLSRWIRDYLFAPLSFMSRRHPRQGPLWLIVAMALCGLWHGAAWTFVLWGVWHGVLLALNQTALRRVFPPAGQRGPWGARDFVGLVLTYGLVGAGWLLFRAVDLGQVGVFLEAIFTLRGGLRPAVIRENGILIIGLLWLGMVAAQILSRHCGALFERWRVASLAARVAEPVVYATMIAATVVLDREAQAFVYFQF